MIKIYKQLGEKECISQYKAACGNLLDYLRDPYIATDTEVIEKFADVDITLNYGIMSQGSHGWKFKPGVAYNPTVFKAILATVSKFGTDKMRNSLLGYYLNKAIEERGLRELVDLHKVDKLNDIRNRIRH